MRNYLEILLLHSAWTLAMTTVLVLVSAEWGLFLVWLKVIGVFAVLLALMSLFGFNDKDTSSWRNNM